MIGERPRIYVFDPVNDFSIGSSRIFSINLKESLGRQGHLVDSPSVADVVLIGRDGIRRYFSDSFPRATGLLGVLNPSREIFSLNDGAIRDIAFIVAGSFEEREQLLTFGKPVFILNPIEQLKFSRRSPKRTSALIIGYHGNRAHINPLPRAVNEAIALLGKESQVELRLLYDFKRLGRVKLAIPHVDVRHVQWTASSWTDEISSFSVGIVPGLESDRRLTRPVGLFRPRARQQHLTYKYSSNFGRVAVLFQMGIPYVADPTPSNSIFWSACKGGELALGAEGWHSALQKVTSHSYQHPSDFDLCEAERAFTGLVSLPEDFVRWLREQFFTGI